MDEQNKDSRSNQPQRGRNQQNNRGDNEGLSNYVFGKVQPQAVPLEEAVLGALMLDRDALPVVMDILRPDSFYLESHQHIYRAVIRLFERSNPVDLLTVTEELRKSGDLEKAGGGYYLVDLTSRVASAANIEYHARIIAQKHIQRELIRVGTKTIKDAYEDTTDVFNLLDEAEKNLFGITQNNLSRSYESMGSLSSKVLKQIEELALKKDGLTGVPTGFTNLDRLTSGWQPSDLIIVAARPGMGKCLGKGTKVLMFNGDFKAVEDILAGDLLMGDDSTPRRVLSTAFGRERMYWVRQNKGIDYRVNESHILSLKRSRTEWLHKNGDVLNISVRDYLAASNKFRTNYKGYKVAVEFTEKPLPLSPYFLGLWLGDGHSSSRITTVDDEVVNWLETYAAVLNKPLVKKTQKHRTPDYTITDGYSAPRGHSLQEKLRALNVINNKHIPQEYLINSTQNRLELLAGLIDRDGHYLVRSNGYEITQKREALTRQIKFLCDSLGFRTSLTAQKAQISSIGFETTVWRLRIYGDLDKVPIRIKRKKTNPWHSPINWQVTGISVEYDKIDDYYGFELDGNGLFLLEDMTVTHNTAFVLAMALNAARDFNKGVALFSLEMASTQLVQRLISMEAEIAGSKLRNGKMEDYEWQQLQSTVERLSTVPVFIDDTPAINIFELRAKCRRLKQQHDIQLIIVDYLQLMTGSTENSRGGNREQEIAGISRALKSMAKELNVPVIALSQLSRAVEVRGGSKKPQLSDLRESGCLTGDARIQDAVNGRLYTIQELAERPIQHPVQVLAVDESLQIKPFTLLKAFYSGRKQVFELTTRSGRSIKASANHPFLKLEGWTTLDQLNVGDKIAIPRSTKPEKPANLLSDNELILLAHLIGDGCILPRQPYHYTSADPENIAVVNEAAKSLFEIDARIVPQENWFHTYLPSPYQLTHGRRHPITQWYETLGLERVRAYAKKIPAGVFQCDEQHITLFLRHLWSTDGNISWKKLGDRKPGAAIYYSTTSRVLAGQVADLLMQSGIMSHMHVVPQGKHRDNYQIHIQGVTDQLVFLKKIGCYGERGKIIPKLIEALEEIEPNPNLGILPKEIWDLVIYPAMQRQGVSYRDLFDKLGLSYSGSIKKNGVSTERLQRVQAALDDDMSGNYTRSNIYWDEIISITPLGIEPVYDATVETAHNFVANGIIVHNSIEQDADIVSFIYRPEYYQILEDENGQSLKGVAEIIVAKHRHGALDTIRLKFTDTFAKFGNLEDPAFAGLGDALTGQFIPSGITLKSRMSDEDIPF